MKIAQVSPLYESVPPKYYGGTERVVSYLTEELVRLGHEVTLFASGDSVTNAELVRVCPEALRLNNGVMDHHAYHVLELELVFQRLSDFDFVHFHTDYFHFPLSRRHDFAHVTTLHGRLDIPDLIGLYKEFRDMPLISISDSQRKPLPWAKWQGTVYHGLPYDLYSFREEPGDYLVFVGRISPEKRVDRAIEIAKRVGMNLKVAAKVDNADKTYFDEVIRPLMNTSLVEYIGEVGDEDKETLLSEALAFVFPIDWPEPFGMVMIESLACGTPVVAFRNGSVPEIIDDGVTGFIVGGIDEAVRAVEQVPSLSRAKCREIFERRFSASRMARDYLYIYQHLMKLVEVA